MDKIEKIDWLEKHSDASMLLSSIARDLEILAKAFRITGNNNMAATLSFIGEDINKATKDMRGAIGESIRENLDKSKEITDTLLVAALGGALSTLKPKEEQL